jgi:hypothetical protein
LSGLRSRGFFFSHWEGFSHKNCVSCACGVWIYIFRIYIALFYSFLQIHTKREFCVLLFLPSKASGQKLNTSKTVIFFSRNTPQEAREKILEESRIPSSQRYDTYLGLPTLVGKSWTKELKGIIDRVWKRMQDWKFKFLSQAR